MTTTFPKNNWIIIYPSGTSARVLYSNPKAHRTVVSNSAKFRPILSAINIPKY